MEKLLRVPEVADLLGVSKPMVYSLANRGKIGSVRLGSRLLFKPGQLEAFIESCSVPAQEEGPND